MSLFRKPSSMDVFITSLLLTLFVTGFSAGFQYQRLETNRTQASLEKALEENAKLQRSEASYKRNFETMQAALALLEEGQGPQSPLSLTIRQGCVDNCQNLKVMAVNGQHVLAMTTKGKECASIRMPEPVFVQMPPTPPTMAAGKDETKVCMTAVLFATHFPYP